MILSLLWKPAQWQRTRLWRVSRYLWRRRYRVHWLALRSRWQRQFAPTKGPLLSRPGGGKPVTQSWSLTQSWSQQNRRLLLSLLLFSLAIGGAIWLDIARLRLNPDANALNDVSLEDPLPTASPVATPPPTSIMQFADFVKPEKSISTPFPDRPTSSVPKDSPTAAPSPSPPPSSPPSPSPVTPSPARPKPSGYHPPYEIAWAHPTNYGNRFAKDINGNPLTQAPIIVLHETVYSADSAVNYFRTPHTNEDDQASYHTLIRLDGTIIYIVPPEKRAYGAGNSVFDGPNGPESAKTHAQYPPSVNNFAYHISLETPIDGENDLPTHSGYTQAQYQSLAWLVAQSTVPPDRITTHRAIDRSSSRIDPRSFRFDYFLQLLQQQTQG